MALIGPTTDNKYFLTSDSIHVYPSAYRGTDATSTPEQAFDPEARTQTERNFTILGGANAEGYTDYIINQDLANTGETDDTWEFVLGGYYFKCKLPKDGLPITNNGATENSKKNIFANIIKVDYNLYAAEDWNKSYRLNDLYSDSPANLDKKVTINSSNAIAGSNDLNTTDKYIFTGLCFTSGPASEEDLPGAIPLQLTDSNGNKNEVHKYIRNYQNISEVPVSAPFTLAGIISAMEDSSILIAQVSAKPAAPDTDAYAGLRPTDDAFQLEIIKNKQNATIRAISSTTTWYAVYANGAWVWKTIVNIEGDQTITGQKTFEEKLIAPGVQTPADSGLSLSSDTSNASMKISLNTGTTINNTGKILSVGNISLDDSEGAAKIDAGIINTSTELDTPVIKKVATIDADNSSTASGTYLRNTEINGNILKKETTGGTETRTVETDIINVSQKVNAPEISAPTDSDLILKSDINDTSKKIKLNANTTLDNTGKKLDVGNIHIDASTDANTSIIADNFIGDLQGNVSAPSLIDSPIIKTNTLQNNSTDGLAINNISTETFRDSSNIRITGGNGRVYIGKQAGDSYSDNVICIGTNSRAIRNEKNNNAIIIGNNSSAWFGAHDSIVLGNNSSIKAREISHVYPNPPDVYYANDSVVIGNNASVEAVTLANISGAIAIGNNARATGCNSVMLGTGTNDTPNSVKFGAFSGDWTRVIVDSGGRINADTATYAYNISEGATQNTSTIEERLTNLSARLDSLGFKQGSISSSGNTVGNIYRQGNYVIGELNSSVFITNSMSLAISPVSPATLDDFKPNASYTDGVFIFFAGIGAGGQASIRIKLDASIDSLNTTGVSISTGGAAPITFGYEV